MDKDNVPPPDPPPDIAETLKDWVTLWQSELAALTVDREMQEHAQALVDLWAGTAQAFVQQAVAQQAFAPQRGYQPQRGADDKPQGGTADERQRPAGRARTAAAPGATAAAAAPDDRDDEIQRLRDRVAELEQRITALERPGRAGRSKAGPKPGQGKPA